MIKAEQGKEIIRVENLCKGFGDLKVLKNINQHVKFGEVVSIIGPSGSGKSTFLRCLNLLEKPESGKSGLKAWILRIKRLTLTSTVRKLAWYFSILMCFPI